MAAVAATLSSPPFPGARVMATYAASGQSSRGRLHQEAECTTRSPFQRDRDRIIHSTAFRRLTHKTQVFVYHEGDHFRSRLTHTIEVAQIARTIARQLALDEDLAEALALAHDLGHPPFGHAGERALDGAARVYGGFDHNAQSLRVVTELERKYADFDGLNLTWETLEGLVKHNGPLIGGNRPDPRETCPPDILAFNQRFDLKLADHASAEAQVAALADDIAYNNHDIDDALACRPDRASTICAMSNSRDGTSRNLARSHQDLADSRLVYEVNRRLITEMVGDVVAESRHRLTALAPATADDIRHAGRPVVAFSDGLWQSARGTAELSVPARLPASSG